MFILISATRLRQSPFDFYFHCLLSNESVRSEDSR